MTGATRSMREPEGAASGGRAPRSGTRLFVALCAHGPSWVEGSPTRGQPLWDEHARFMDDLYDRGFVVLGGPVDDHAGSLLVCRARSKDEVGEVMRADPWNAAGILHVDDVREWTLYLDAAGIAGAGGAADPAPDVRVD